MKIHYLFSNLILSVALFMFASVVVAPTVLAACQANGLAIPQCTRDDVKSGDIANNPIVVWINFFINLLSVIIVAGAVVMLAVAGLQYLSAADNAQKVQASKQRIFTISGALLFYFFLYGFAQWLVPGGVF